MLSKVIFSFYNTRNARHIRRIRIENFGWCFNNANRFSLAT